MNKKRRSNLLESIATLLLGLVAVIIASIIVTYISNNFSFKKNDQLQQIKTDTEKIKEVVTPYEYKSQLNKIVIVENFQNTTKGYKPTDYFVRNITTSGLFEQGFIYIKASSNNKPLSNVDNVYVKMSFIVNGKYQEFGGHLIKSKSLETPKTDFSTELLYDISDIKYKESYYLDDVEVLSADWLKILNQGNSKKIIGFSSSPSLARIDEISFYYKCIKGTECKIDIN